MSGSKVGSPCSFDVCGNAKKVLAILERIKIRILERTSAVVQFKL